MIARIHRPVPGLRPVRRYLLTLPGLLAIAALLAGCAAGPQGLVGDGAGRPVGDAPAASAEQPAAAAGDKAPGDEQPVYSSFERDTLYTLLVAEFAGRRGELDTAVQNYMNAVRQTGDSGVAERATRVALYARNDAASLDAAAQWAALDADNPEALGVHAALLLRQGQADAAYGQFERIVALAGNQPRRAWASIADLLGREQDRAGALDMMKRLSAARPGDLDARFALAELATRTGNLELAVGELESIREAAPDDERSAEFLARVLQSQGRGEQALAVLERYLARRPEAHGVRTSYARLLLGEQRFDDARAQFARVTESQPDNAEARFAYAIVLLQNQQTDAARDQLRKLVASGRRDDSANYYLGQIAENAGDNETAMGHYRQVEGGEFRLNAQVRLALLMADEGDLDAARAHLQGLRRVYNGETVRLYRAEADILVRAGELDAAMQVYDIALAELPDNTDLQYARAMVAARADRLDELERDLRDILSREPDNADALNALGYTLADKTDRLQEALELIERALELKPNDHYVIDSMGWVLYRLGRHEEALVQLRRAHSLQADAEVAAHLGEVLWVMGRRDEAREVWREALEAAPESEPLLEVIRRFDAD